MNTNAFAPSALDAHRAAKAIMRDRWERNFVLDHYTPAGWFECDVFEVTAAGYFREYEVKLSRSDFFADGKKGERGWRVVGGRDGCRHTFRFEDGQCRCLHCGGRSERCVTDLKHDRLARHDVRGPTKFYFVAPLGLLAETDLPPWAGLIELINRGPDHRPYVRWNCIERRAAPQLHRVRVEEAIRVAARDTCYWRMHRLLKVTEGEPYWGSPPQDQ